MTATTRRVEIAFMGMTVTCESKLPVVRATTGNRWFANRDAIQQRIWTATDTTRRGLLYPFLSKSVVVYFSTPVTTTPCMKTRWLTKKSKMGNAEAINAAA